MSVINSIMRFLQVGDYDEDDEYGEDGYDEPEVNEPERRSKRTSSSKITAIPGGKSRDSVAPLYDVCMLKPTSVDSAREVTEAILDKRPVILNLEGIEIDMSQRIIDYTSGTCAALNGQIHPVTKYVFLVTPDNVHSSGNYDAMVDTIDSIANLRD